VASRDDAVGAARERAAVAVRLDGEPCSAGWWAVPSASNPGASWHVRHEGPGCCWCGCPGFAHRQTCRHVQAVALAAEVEQQQHATERRLVAAGKLEEIAEMFL
jgi:hypothetical protein